MTKLELLESGNLTLVADWQIGAHAFSLCAATRPSFSLRWGCLHRLHAPSQGPACAE